MRVGLASYSLRKLTLDQALAVCRDLELRYISIKEVHLPRADAVALAEGVRKIAEAGLEVCGGGVVDMPKNDPAAIRADFEYARAVGFPLIVAMPHPDTLDTVEAMVREFGIRVAIHNHGPENKFYPTPREALARVRGRDRRFGVCMDIGHTLRAGADPVAMVHECGPRLLDMHLKDLKVASDAQSQCELGKGVIDFPGLFRALRKTGFSGLAAVEYEINPTDPVVGLKECFAYLRGLLDTLPS